MATKKAEQAITQDVLDELIQINEFIVRREGVNNSLVNEIEEAVLDSAKLSTEEWMALLKGIKEIEALIPHVEFIIKLKKKHQQPSS